MISASKTGLVRLPEYRAGCRRGPKPEPMVVAGGASHSVQPTGEACSDRMARCRTGWAVPTCSGLDEGGRK